MQRQPDETFEDYRLRRALTNRNTKQHLRGTLVFNSRPHGLYRSGVTFVRPAPPVELDVTSDGYVVHVTPAAVRRENLG